MISSAFVISASSNGTNGEAVIEESLLFNNWSTVIICIFGYSILRFEIYGSVIFTEVNHFTTRRFQCHKNAHGAF